MFAGKTLINKICKIHHRTLQVVYDDFNKSYNELLCGSFRRVAPFVEHFMILHNKIIFNQGIIY